MCLKYFVGYTTCEHHEYLGSCHCSCTPCHLDKQQFYYIYDNFRSPLSPESSGSDSVFGTGALACSTCAAEHGVQLNPGEVPVQYYAPTNNVRIEEVRPTGYNLPIRVVAVEPVDVEDDDCDHDYDYDYKSLSAADEEEWGWMDERIHGVVDTSVGHDAQEQRAFEQGQVARQLSSLPNYLAQQRQHWSFVPPGPSPDAYAMDYPKPHMAYVAAPPVLPVPNGRGDVTGPSTAHSAALSPRPSDSPSPPMPAPKAGDAAKPTTPATPAIPAQCPTEPRLPPTGPSIVGRVTDAYLRIEAAKRRRMRERARGAGSSRLRNILPVGRDTMPVRRGTLPVRRDTLPVKRDTLPVRRDTLPVRRDTLPVRRDTLPVRRDTLPARSMSLADCMVTKREKRINQNVQYRKINMGEVEIDTWSSLPFAGEESDTEGGAEEDAGVVETGES